MSQNYELNNVKYLFLKVVLIAMITPMTPDGDIEPGGFKRIDRLAVEGRLLCLWLLSFVMESSGESRPTSSYAKEHVWLIKLALSEHSDEARIQLSQEARVVTLTKKQGILTLIMQTTSGACCKVLDLLCLIPINTQLRRTLSAY